MTASDSSDAATGTKRPLWPIWLAIPVVVLTGLVSAVAAGLLLWLGFGRPPLVKGWSADNQLEVVRLALFVVGGIGGVVALVVAYRKQRVAEAADKRAAAADSRENSKHFNDRFLAVSAELGNPSAAVRLAAVYALASLADDWQAERQTCIDVLCAYIRLPYQPDNGQPDWKPGEREVRLSIIRVIRDHLSGAIGSPSAWHGHRFDFTGATFDGGDFGMAKFSAGVVMFNAAKFSGGDLTFFGAEFGDGEVNFHRAEFSGSNVGFYFATFSGGGRVNFHQANFTGGKVSFEGARFTGGKVDFTDATFSGGEVDISVPMNYSHPPTFSPGNGTERSGLRLPRPTPTPTSAEVAAGPAPHEPK